MQKRSSLSKIGKKKEHRKSKNYFFISFWWHFYSLMFFLYLTNTSQTECLNNSLHWIAIQSNVAKKNVFVQWVAKIVLKKTEGRKKYQICVITAELRKFFRLSICFKYKMAEGISWPRCGVQQQQQHDVCTRGRLNRGPAVSQVLQSMECRRLLSNNSNNWERSASLSWPRSKGASRRRAVTDR